MNELGFDVAINTVVPLTPEYGKLEISLDSSTIVVDNNGTSHKTTYSEILQLIKCETDNFNYSDINEIKFKGIPSY